IIFLFISLLIFFLNTFFFTVKTSDISELQMKTVKHGDNITIKCDLNMAEENKNIYLAWYKQNFGKLPENIVRSFGDNKKCRFEPAFNSGHFSINVDGVFDLSINEIKEDDVGTYLCGKTSTSTTEFVSGALLMFEAEKNVHSALTKMVIRRGESTMMQCSVQADTSSCVGNYSVYWFKHGESDPGIIYTHVDSSDQCEKRSEAGYSTQSCVYKLPKMNLSLTNTGTYYCAIVACGKIIFGNGIAVEAASEGVTFYNIWSIQNKKFCFFHKGACNYNPNHTNQAEDSTILNYAAVRFTQKPSSSTTCRVKDVYAQIKVS
uniref:Ig-like domain-containing protein n=1 Tax=Electrophorus electricus TaxID=8005 RepID=A0A4W4E6B1_ELEEL